MRSVPQAIVGALRVHPGPPAGDGWGVDPQQRGQPAEQVLNNDLVKGTKAYQNKNIVYLDPNYWYLSGGGLVSLSEMVKEVEAALP